MAEAAAINMPMPATVAPRPKTNKWLVTISITFGTLMGTIDTSIVNVALPHLRGTLSHRVKRWVE